MPVSLSIACNFSLLFLSEIIKKKKTTFMYICSTSLLVCKYILDEPNL